MSGAVAAARHPLRVAVSAIYAHPVMVAGIVAISVGAQLVIEHPFGHTQPAWVAVILGGPVLFLAGRAIFEYAVFGRVSRDCVAGVLVLAAISPATIFLPPVLVAAAAALVLAGIAVADAARARGDRTAAAAAAELAELSGAENSARRRPIAWVEEGLQRVRRVMAASPGEALAILAANAAESAAVLALPEPELQPG